MVKLVVLQFHKVDDFGEVQRLHKECPNAECGAENFMANHFDRNYCGYDIQKFYMWKIQCDQVSGTFCLLLIVLMLNFLTNIFIFFTTVSYDCCVLLLRLQDGDELTGLHCFRHLRDQLATSIDSINKLVYSGPTI